MTGTYGDIEKILTGWVATALSIRTCTELPAVLPAEIVQIVRFGGSRPSVPFDDARVDVDYYAQTRSAAHDGAERVAHALVYDLPGYTVDGVMVVAAECISAPSWAPYDNTQVRRFTAAYQVRTHNPI